MNKREAGDVNEAVEFLIVNICFLFEKVCIKYKL